MITQAIVFGILLALVAGAVWAFRKSRAIGADADTALAEMGNALAAPFDAKKRVFTGRLEGRAVTVIEDKQGSEGEYNYFVRIHVATKTPVTMELLRQNAGFIPGAIQDLKTGDVPFDRAFVVRSSQPEALLDVLTPDTRRQLLDWQTTGWLWEIRVHDGELRYAGGEGLFRRDQIDKTMTVVRAMTDLAARLE